MGGYKCRINNVKMNDSLMGVDLQGLYRVSSDSFLLMIKKIFVKWEVSIHDSIEVNSFSN